MTRILDSDEFHILVSFDKLLTFLLNSIFIKSSGINLNKMLNKTPVTLQFIIGSLE